jgi:hypothetical protein
MAGGTRTRRRLAGRRMNLENETANDYHLVATYQHPAVRVSQIGSCGESRSSLVSWNLIARGRRADQLARSSPCRTDRPYPLQRELQRAHLDRSTC